MVPLSPARTAMGVSLSATPRPPAEAAVQIGPVATSDGHDSLNGSTWIVSVTNPA